MDSPVDNNASATRKTYILREGDGIDLYKPKRGYRSSTSTTKASPQQVNISQLPTSQIWPLKFNAVISGALATVPAAIMLFNLRKALVLKTLAAKTSYLFAGGVPALTTAVGHFVLITYPLVENGFTDCPVCLQMRGGIFQAISGGIYPLIMGPVTLYPLVYRMKSFRLPGLMKDSTAVAKYFYSLAKPTLTKYLLPILAFQCIAGMGLTYLQQDAYLTNVVPYMNQVNMSNTSQDDTLELET